MLGLLLSLACMLLTCSVLWWDYSPAFASSSWSKSRSSAASLPYSSPSSWFTWKPRSRAAVVTAERLGSLSHRRELATSTAVCIISLAISGVNTDDDNEIGVATHSLASLLGGRGFRVTLVAAAGNESLSRSGHGTWTERQSMFASLGVELISLESTFLPEYAASAVESRYSHLAYLWLLAHSSQCDIVHFHDRQAVGFHTSLAISQRLHAGLDHITVVVSALSSTLEDLLEEGALPEDINALRVDYMERSSIELANIVVVPSEAKRTWLKEQGYHLPPLTQVWRSPLPAEGQSFALRSGVISSHASSPSSPLVEFVFMGRLDRSDGVHLFVGVAKRLERSLRALNRSVQITLIGSLPNVNEENHINLRKDLAHLVGEKRWKLYTNLSYADKMHYLASGARVAVLPPLRKHHIQIVLGCVSRRVPFVASNVDGLDELLHPEYVHQVLFPADDPNAMLAALLAYSSGVVGGSVSVARDPARLARSASDVNEQWLGWHAALSTHRPPRSTGRPLVSVVMTTWNRTNHVQAALQSLMQQTYCCIEVIIVDDGNDELEVLSYMSRVEALLHTRPGWRLVRIANSFLGGARNAGARLATGELLLWMDDDNVAKPDEVDTFVTAMTNSEVDVDILTCFINTFVGSEPPDSDWRQTIWQPDGGAVAASALYNLLGDANFIIKRTVFEALHGFATARLAFSDYELLLRAALSGYRIQVVPRALFWKRGSADAMTKHVDLFAELRFATLPLHRALPHQLFQVIQVAQARAGEGWIPIQEVADSVKDFYRLQGYRGWTYGYLVENDTFVPFPPPVETFVDMWSQPFTYSAADKLNAACAIDQYHMHPCVTEGQRAVSVSRRWTSNEVGLLVIRGRVSRRATCGDGVTLSIRCGSDKLVRYDMYEPQELQLFHTANVTLGDTIDFVTHPLQDQHCDKIWMHVQVEMLRKQHS